MRDQAWRPSRERLGVADSCEPGRTRFDTPSRWQKSSAIMSCWNRLRARLCGRRLRAGTGARRGRQGQARQLSAIERVVPGWAASRFNHMQLSLVLPVLSGLSPVHAAALGLGSFRATLRASLTLHARPAGPGAAAAPARPRNGTATTQARAVSGLLSRERPAEPYLTTGNRAAA
jgi:hypothetical protein